jgi:two-component system phosphate regulon sensor histidine kinase PhoR
MTLILLAAVLVLVAVVGVRVWRKWIAPWRELEELVSAVTGGGPPRKFLMTANPRASALGHALEQLAAEHRELKRRNSERGRSLEAVLAALPDGLAVVDDQRRLQLTNVEFRRLFHLTEDVPGVSLLEATRDAAVDEAVALSFDEDAAQRATIKISLGTQAAAHLEVSAVPFTTVEGRARGAVVLFRDVTQAHQVEALRRDFVANVSHELRTPLSIFRGYIETLLDDPQQPPDELVRILEVMDRHAERLTLMVEDILSLAKLESPAARLDYTEIYLPDFLSGIWRDWEKRFNAKLLRATLDAPEDLPVLIADENRLQEVIYNLLDNAVKYSQAEGRITVSAARAADELRISVSDEGAGIPAADLPRVFERFYRADKARSREIGGTGLGLSIVKHIVQLHGGSVDAQSALGRGSTFTVTLPIAPQIDVAPPAGVSQNRHT